MGVVEEHIHAFVVTRKDFFIVKHSKLCYNKGVYIRKQKASGPETGRNRHVSKTSGALAVYNLEA